MTLSPAQLGFIRGVGYAVLAAVVTYLADPAHLTFLNGSLGLVVAGVAQALEQAIEAKTGSSLFGAAIVK